MARSHPWALRLVLVCLALGSFFPAVRAEPADDGFDDQFGAPFDRPGAAAEPAPASEAAASSPPSPLPRSGAAHGSLQGLTGGVHAVDAASGPPGTFRIGFFLDTFRRDGFLAAGDRHHSGGARLSLSVTPLEQLELALQASAASHLNRSQTPAVLQTLGDVSFFVKGFARIRPWASVGGDFGLILLNAIDGIGFQGDATGVSLRANAAFDLRELPRPLPLRARSSLRYVFDNSAQLAEDLERARYAALNNPAAAGNEYRHLVTPVERLAYDVSRVDRLGLQLGLEIPLQPFEGFYVSPILEWGVGVPVNRQGYSCLLTRAAADRDGCLRGEGFSAYPSSLTFAVRAEPKLPGLAVLLGVDVATSGANQFVRELPPNAPYTLYLGLSYAYDPLPRAPQPIVKHVEVPIARQQGRIVGHVLTAQTGEPISGALVHVEGDDTSALVSDASGQFITYRLDPGRHRMSIEKEGFEAGQCEGHLRDDFSAEQITCTLRAQPATGAVEGRVLGRGGRTLAGAEITLSGPAALTLQTDERGAFAEAALPAGHYDAVVRADGYLAQRVQLEVPERGQVNPVVTLMPKPTEVLVERAADRLILRQPIRFVGQGAEIDPKSLPVLAQVADLLLRHPELGPLEIQGHTDARASQEQSQTLSQQWAEAVRAWLIEAGVAAERLRAVGYGDSRPLAPNITPANRARNRRIELMLGEED